MFKRQTRRKEKKNEHLKSHFASSSLHSRLINTAVENMLEKGVNRYIHYGSTHTSNTSDTHPQAFFFSSILSCRYIHTYATLHTHNMQAIVEQTSHIFPFINSIHGFVFGSLFSVKGLSGECKSNTNRLDANHKRDVFFPFLHNAHTMVFMCVCTRI